MIIKTAHIMFLNASSTLRIPPERVQFDANRGLLRISHMDKLHLIPISNVTEIVLAPDETLSEYYSPLGRPNKPKKVLVMG